MRRNHQSSEFNEEENPFALSIGDLMSALLLIFILLLSATLLQLKKQIDEREQVKRSIIAQLKGEMDEFDIEIDPQTGAIRVKESVLFDINKSDLKHEGSDFLKNFIPKYVYILLHNDTIVKNLSQIMIEGHTDSTGTYEHNLNLSLSRSNSVANYIFTDEFGQFLFKERFQNFLSVNGRSFKEPLVSNSTDSGRAKNRRVEFKFRLKDWDIFAQDSIMKAITK